MSVRPVAGAWKLALLVSLALCVAGCGRGSQAKKHASAAPQAQGTVHRSTSAASVGGARVTNAATNAAADDAESDAEDHTQDKSDQSLEHLAALPAEAQLPAGRWKVGVNYMPLVPGQSTSAAPGKVEVMEVFWLGCPHCYALEPQLQRWLKTKPAYVQFVRVPVMWGPMHRAHARLFYTLVALGKEDLVEKAFDTIQHGDPLVANGEDDTLKAQEAFARANGVNAQDYAKAYNSPDVAANLERAEQITQRYRIESVPLLVVDGKYTTDITMAGSTTAVFSLIDDLATAEHTHGGRM